MGALKLTSNKSSNRFELSEKYLPDIWDVTSWSVYIDATETNQKKWRNRAGKNHNYGIDFSEIECEDIKDELKYCFHFDFESGISIASIGEKYGRIKNYIKYYNDRQYKSIIETDISDFEIYIQTSLGLKKTVNSDKRVSVKEGKMVKKSRPNKIITTLQTMINIVKEYNEKDLGMYEKDIWHSSELPVLEESKEYNRKIDFSSISNTEFKNQLKEFCKHQLNTITFSSGNIYANSVSCFFTWLNDSHLEIIHLNELNREVLEEYFIWLRTKSGFSRYKINLLILQLKVFFETGILLELDNFPTSTLILENDYAFKHKREAHPFVDSELRTIIEFIPKLNPKVYGRIIYCILNLGCRINEILRLKVNQLKQYDDGSYYLILYQFKTRAEYQKSISDSAAKIMLAEINNNKKIHGDNVDYVFLNESGRPINQGELNRVINTYIINNNIKDRDGKLLHCNTHRFRSTLACNLMNSGYDVESTGKLLGQKSLSSLGYYAVVSDEKVIEQLTPRMEKDELLISNIGKFDEKTLSDYNNPTQLCNGWCVRSTTMGQCAKANHCLECNMFIPTLAHLSMYEMQLRQVEAAIEVAKANDMDLLVERNEKTKASLEKIISRIRERREKNE